MLAAKPLLIEGYVSATVINEKGRYNGHAPSNLLTHKYVESNSEPIDRPSRLSNTLHTMTPEIPSRTLEYDPENDRYTLSFPSNGRPTVEIVLAVAELADVEPTEMEPIYHAFDPDEFDSIYETRSDGGIDIDGEVSVTVASYEVTIERDGRVAIEPPK